MKKILLSLAIIGVVAGVTLGVTGAWWSDQGVSANQSFHAGSLNLRLSNDGTTWADNVTNTWNVSSMAPGGAPYVSSLYMKNNASIGADYLKFTLKNTPSPAGMDKVMRITELSYAGKNLLIGGAGAVIPDYVAPTNCTVTTSHIKNAISSATNGDVICVASGDYTTSYEGSGAITVDREVTIASINGPATTIVRTGFTIAADNVTIAGLTITDAGINSTDHNNLTVRDNIITNINSATSNVYGITAVSSSSAVDGIVIKNNQINNIHYTGSLNPGFSAGGIGIGWSNGSEIISGLVIQNNIISNITSNTGMWPIGHGAYGIIVNHATSGSGYTDDPQILNNTITNLEGLWAHAIGLEGNTYYALVQGNDIGGLTDHKSPSDAVAVQVEDNASASTIIVEKNNFSSDDLGVQNVVTGTTVNAKNNWWGDFNPSDQVSGNVDYTPYAGGAFVGFINGKDYNSNGFADLNDFYGVTYPSFDNNPIVVENPNLLPNSATYHTLKMGVQLDGPTTPNTYQGGTLGMDMTVIMGQGPAN